MIQRRVLIYQLCGLARKTPTGLLVLVVVAYLDAFLWCQIGVDHGREAWDVILDDAQIIRLAMRLIWKHLLRAPLFIIIFVQLRI